jgi:hypothetical protein
VNVEGLKFNFKKALTHQTVVQRSHTTLKDAKELLDSGLITRAEFQQIKNEHLANFSSPPPQVQQGYPPQGPYASPSPHQQIPPGNGPVPDHRRSGWSVWVVYLLVIIIGSILGSVVYVMALESEQCYTETDYYGYEYDYCEPDYGLMLLSAIVNWGSTIVAMIIYIWWAYSMYSEFNVYLQREVLPPFLAACIPIFSIYAFYRFCDELNKEATKRGRPGFIDPTVTCCLTFIIGIGWPIYQGKLNEFWDMVASQQRG